MPRTSTDTETRTNSASVLYASRSLEDIDYSRQQTKRNQYLAAPAGRLSSCFDPMEILDLLGERDMEGHSPLYGLMYAKGPEVMADALDMFMHHRRPGGRAKCLKAVTTWIIEDMQRSAMVHDERRGTQAGNKEVYCIFCQMTVYSDYHQNICGDEDVVTVEDRIAMALASDDPDQFI